MAETHELHRRAGESLAETVRRVAEAEWHRPTPCDEWDVRDLLHHIAWSNLWVAPLVGGKGLAEVAPTLEGDVLGDDPVAVTLRSIEESSEAFADGGDRIVQLSRGPAPASEYCFERMNDLVVHNWDLARGIGVEVVLDVECMEVALAGFRPLEDRLRAVGELGPDVEFPEDADLQTRYLAFFGRRADWSPPA
ncbi:MAG: TIGR03086 family metal-binding protein [Actinomycetota bacterium]